jgi:hypothetical protein
LPLPGFQFRVTQRLTLKLFQKSGRFVDDVFIVSDFVLAYDFQPYFVRLFG